MYSVFIGDDNQNWLNALAVIIEREPEFKVIAKSRNGKDALALIEDLRPEIILLDIIMPEYDGIYIVNHIRNEMDSYNPIIYILSGIGTDTIVAVLNEMYVDYYSLKPVDATTVIHNLNMAISKRGRIEKIEVSETAAVASETIVKELILRLGIPIHRMLSKCMIEATLLYLETPNPTGTLTKKIYPLIAQKFQISESSVEKNIRNAISLMQKGQTALYKQIFSYKLNDKITNSEFLAILSEYIYNQTTRK